MIDQFDERTLNEQYDVNENDYAFVLVQDTCSYTRLRNCLLRNGILTVRDLLHCSPNKLRCFWGFGKLTFIELENYLNTLLQQTETNPYKGLTEQKEESTVLYCSVDKISEGDWAYFENKSLSPKEAALLERLKEASDTIDPQLKKAAISGLTAVTDIVSALQAYTTKQHDIQIAKEKLATIPMQRRSLSARWLITCYTDDELRFPALMQLVKDDNQTLEEYAIDNAELVAYGGKVMSFLNWCKFDSIKEIGDFLQKVSSRELYVIKERLSKKTLEQVGQTMNITRERVRQIEAKVQRKFNYFQSVNRILLKLFIDLNETRALSSSDIISFLGEHGQVVNYLLINCTKDEVVYDKQWAAFLFEDLSMPDKIQSYIDSLPDLFKEERLQEYIDIAVEEYSYPEKLVRASIKNNFGCTEGTYHRSRLKLTTVYGLVFQKYYPDGIRVYDERAIEDFRQHVLEDYNIDLSKKTDHAIGSILARIGILRGRGFYKYRTKEPLISKGLAERIHDYIIKSDSPIFLMNTIFDVFEDDLLAEGIDNKYYLQAILRELYEQEWFFKRDYITKDESLTSLYSSIVGFIRNAKRPVSKKEIYSAFPGITEIIINIATDDTSVINLFGEYLHVSCLRITQQEIDYLKKQVEKALCVNDVCNCHDLYSIIDRDNPELLKRNYIYYAFGCYSLLNYLFEEDYVFSRPFIARESVTIDRPSEMVSEMVRASDLLQISEIQEFARDNHFTIYSILDFLNTLNETHLLISQTEIASVSYIGVDESIAKTIEKLIIDEVKDTMPIVQLACVARFPKLNVPWNSWLIYSILKKWSTELGVTTSYPQFRLSAPLVSIAGHVNPQMQYIEKNSHNGALLGSDDLDNIDDLIADLIEIESEEL